MFKVTMTNLGRKHATEIQMFADNPDYNGLYAMAKRQLLSDGINFILDADPLKESDYPVSGHILAGAHYVGNFNVEEVAR